MKYFDRFKVPTPEMLSYHQRLTEGPLTRHELEGHRDSLLELYKEHLKLLLEANVFIYAVTGALASFVITHAEIPHIRLVLWFSIILGSAFAVFFLFVSFGFKAMDAELGSIGTALRLNTYQTIDALPIGLWVSAIALAAMVGLLLIAFFHFPIAPVRSCPLGIPT